MLARRLIPSLTLAAEALKPGHDPVRDWTKLVRILEDEGADEILVCARGLLTASVERASDTIEAIASEVAIGLLVEGGSSLAELEALVQSGAGAVVIDASQPALIREAERAFGKAMVAAAVRGEPTGDAVAASIEAAAAGARELFIEGPGVDPSLLRAITDATAVPIIAWGAVGSLEDVRRAFQDGRADAVVLTTAVLAGFRGISEVKRYLAAAGIVVRGVR